MNSHRTPSNSVMAGKGAYQLVSEPYDPHFGAYGSPISSSSSHDVRRGSPEEQRHQEEPRYGWESPHYGYGWGSHLRSSTPAMESLPPPPPPPPPENDPYCYQLSWHQQWQYSPPEQQPQTSISSWSSRQGFPEDPRHQLVEESLRSIEGTLLNLDHKLNMLDDRMKYRREVYPSYFPAMEPPPPAPDYSYPPVITAPFSAQFQQQISPPQQYEASPSLPQPPEQQRQSLQQHEEIEPKVLDEMPVRKLGSTSWCRRCNVDCTNMEGLVIHSFTSEHQHKTMSLVRSIKQNIQSATSYVGTGDNMASVNLLQMQPGVADLKPGQYQPLVADNSSIKPVNQLDKVVSSKLEATNGGTSIMRSDVEQVAYTYGSINPSLGDVQPDLEQFFRPANLDEGSKFDEDIVDGKSPVPEDHESLFSIKALPQFDREQHAKIDEESADHVANSGCLSSDIPFALARSQLVNHLRSDTTGSKEDVLTYEIAFLADCTGHDLLLKKEEAVEDESPLEGYEVMAEDYMLKRWDPGIMQNLSISKLVSGSPVIRISWIQKPLFSSLPHRNDPEFARELASLTDFYENDAFGTTHRAHASTKGVAKCLKLVVACFLIQKELDYLVGIVSNPKRPFAAIVGGSKVSSMISVIEPLFENVDILLLGGGMIFTFYKARRYSVGSSLVEEDKLALATSVFEKAKSKGVSLLLPIDVVVASKFAGLVEWDPGIVEGLSIRNFEANKGKYGKHVDIYLHVWVNEQGIPDILHSLEVAASFGVVSIIKETPKSIFKEYFICILWDPGKRILWVPIFAGITYIQDGNRRNNQRWFAIVKSMSEKVHKHMISPMNLSAGSSITVGKDVSDNDSNFGGNQILGETGIITTKPWIASESSQLVTSIFLKEWEVTNFRFQVMVWDPGIKLQFQAIKASKSEVRAHKAKFLQLAVSN